MVKQCKQSEAQSTEIIEMLPQYSNPQRGVACIVIVTTINCKRQKSKPCLAHSAQLRQHSMGRQSLTNPETQCNLVQLRILAIKYLILLYCVLILQ